MSLERIKVLVVDDEPITTNNWKEILNNRGLKCKTANSEYEALEIIDNGYLPESALIDYLIPSGDISKYIDQKSFGTTGGLRLCQSIQRATGGFCRTVLTSGLSLYRELPEMKGVWGYYCKPIFNDIDIMVDELGKGVLTNEELRKQTLNLNMVFNNRGKKDA
jgi:CheY-like chemotaxis protein